MPDTVLGPRDIVVISRKTLTYSTYSFWEQWQNSSLYLKKPGIIQIYKWKRENTFILQMEKQAQRGLGLIEVTQFKVTIAGLEPKNAS